MRALEKILVPVDFSSWSEEAFSAALFLAARFGALVEVVHVSDPLKMGPLAPGDVDVERWALRRLEHEMSTLESTPKVAGRLIDGANRRPADAILDAIEEGRFDLVVMGTRGRTGLPHVLLGSVAEEIVRRASCPVMVVRLPKM